MVEKILNCSFMSMEKIEMKMELVKPIKRWRWRKIDKNRKNR
jgi:hypothetical protein